MEIMQHSSGAITYFAEAVDRKWAVAYIENYEVLGGSRLQFLHIYDQRCRNLEEIAEIVKIFAKIEQDMKELKNGR